MEATALVTEAPEDVPDEDVPKAPEWPPYCNPRYVMPATIQVIVPGPDGRPTRMPVAVQKALMGSKPYRGGYRHKKTGLLYHHASSQSEAGMDRQDGWFDPEHKSHRDTQTYETKTRAVMTGREAGTQMARKDLLIDDARDAVVVSKTYFSSGQLEEVRRASTVVVQCYWRGYVARSRTWTIRAALYGEYVAEKEALAKVAACFLPCPTRRLELPLTLLLLALNGDPPPHHGRAPRPPRPTRSGGSLK
jgi:hypothetical protein